DVSAWMALTCASSLMSAPAMKALSPAPVRITPRTAASSRASSKTVFKSSHVRWLSAFSTFGRLSVTKAMAFFFSYATVSRVDVAAVGVISVRLLRQRYSDERAEPGDRLADDQVLHLERTFVGIERLGIREEARHVVVDDDAVAAEQLSRPGDRLAHPGRRERLRQRRLLVGQ